MFNTKALTVLCLSAMSLAAPHALTSSTIHLSKRACPGPTATILLENQDAHTSAQATICVDNLADDINAVFAHSAIDTHDGHYYVTSAHMLSYTEGFPAYCTFQNNDNGDLYGRMIKDEPDLENWVTLGGPGMVDLGRSRIQCHVDQDSYSVCLGISGDVYTQCLNRVTNELTGGNKTPTPAPAPAPPATCA